MARLLLGPILRHVGRTDATVWVETDGPCAVEVLGHRARTFHIAGHHYALVRIAGLASGASHPYDVRLDGDVAWPEPESGYPPSAIRTLTAAGPVRLVFGSCRVARPHTPPHTLSPDEHDEGRGGDALTALAERLRHGSPEALPDVILHLGDQVYSDAPPAPVLAFLRGRRPDVPGPDDETVDYEEFARLYLDSWSEPSLRWLLSTVANAMMFDDHDVHDDWNTSLAWREQQARLSWWHDRMVAALMACWVYQHIGNLDEGALAEEGTLERVERRAEDATEVLRELADRAETEPSAMRWSFRWDLGRARLVVVDSRVGRVLEPGRRDMVGAAEWAWLDGHLRGDTDHLLVASTVPVLLPPGLHDLEAWNERLCDGAWGARAAAWSEGLRQRFDLEHWAAFGAGFERMARLLRDVAAGARGRAPATISVLGGDVHFGYVAEADRPPGASPIRQLVGSPLRNRLEPNLVAMVRASLSPGPRLLTRVLARLAGAGRPPIQWRLTHGPWFDNHLCELVLAPGHARLIVRTAQTGGRPELRSRLLLRLDA
jgi:hypothetical protein